MNEPISWEKCEQSLRHFIKKIKINVTLVVVVDRS